MVQDKYCAFCLILGTSGTSVEMFLCKKISCSEFLICTLNRAKKLYKLIKQQHLLSTPTVQFFSAFFWSGVPVASCCSLTKAKGIKKNTRPKITTTKNQSQLNKAVIHLFGVSEKPRIIVTSHFISDAARLLDKTRQDENTSAVIIYAI